MAVFLTVEKAEAYVRRQRAFASSESWAETIEIDEFPLDPS